MIFEDYNEKGKRFNMIKAEGFDELFESGGDIMPYLDLANARRPGLEQKRVNVDFPAWMVAALDKQAARLGVSRQALIKLWTAERLEQTQ
jgi:hypothetical protein